MYAAEYGYCDIIKILAAKGANLKAKDNNDKTALNLAQENEHKEAAKLIEKLLQKN